MHHGTFSEPFAISNHLCGNKLDFWRIHSLPRDSENQYVHLWSRVQLIAKLCLIVVGSGIAVGNLKLCFIIPTIYQS